ncbi:MAG: kinase [Alphaproteobacteria bacterium]|nr:MAG: kinase [Alphaproteobacteria bacterium]
MERVFCIGAAHWDHLARADATPEPGCDLPGRIERRPGGVALNIAHGLADAGVTVELIAAIGRDAEGAALAAEIAALGIGTQHLHRAEHTDRYLAIEGPDGELFASVADCRVLEATAHDLADTLIGLAPDHAVIDGNLPAGAIGRLLRGLPEILPTLIPASPAKAAALRDVLVPPRRPLRIIANRAEAEAICATQFSCSTYAARGLAVIAGQAVVTDGAREAAAHFGDDRVAVATPAPGAAASLTGAGDRFAAGFIAADLAAATLQDCLSAGLAAAARHTARPVP